LYRPGRPPPRQDCVFLSPICGEQHEPAATAFPENTPLTDALVPTILSAWIRQRTTRAIEQQKVKDAFAKLAADERRHADLVGEIINIVNNAL